MQESTLLTVAASALLTLSAANYMYKRRIGKLLRNIPLRTINLEGKDEYKYCEFRGGWYMAVHKSNSSHNYFLNPYEWERIVSIEKIFSKQPIVDKIKRKFNHLIKE